LCLCTTIKSNSAWYGPVRRERARVAADRGTQEMRKNVLREIELERREQERKRREMPTAAPEHAE